MSDAVNNIDYKYLSELLFPDVKMTPEELEAKYPLRTLPEGAVVSRMAPSPTGFVHLGNLVQGLTSERLCHQSGGVLFLRVEDTDAKREVPGAVETLISSLSHYGICFDEGAALDNDGNITDNGIYGPYKQSVRGDIYHVYAKLLVSRGMAYPCFATEDELEKMRVKQEELKVNYGYYGEWATWRDRPVSEIEAAIGEGKGWVLRFRSEGSIENKIKFTDLIKGEMLLSENDIDHVLLKSDGIPTYHFAHAVDDHLMRTTHVVRGDEWLATLPFHIQLFRALDFRLPKYLHIGPLMKMDGESKRKLSKRKDPELALTYYSAEGFPVESVYEYIMTILNSNFEDWRRANPDLPADSFKFSYKKMNPAGSLFDMAKLCDVSKNVISRMTADKVYDELILWAREHDAEFASVLEADPGYAKSIIGIGRGIAKPRKDYGTWVELRHYMELFYDEYFKVEDDYPENFCCEDIKTALSGYLPLYSEDDDQNEWFERIKSICGPMGYASDMKAYKADPSQYRGNVGDISMMLRVAVTGRQNSPDMFTVMKILGGDVVRNRITDMIAKL